MSKLYVPTEKIIKVTQLRRILLRERLENRITYFVPYPKQKEFFALGRHKRERLYQAGNQLYGKTTAGAVETALHLTGCYPDWWDGRRFDHPTKGWAVGESSSWVRDQAQSRLCGEHGTAADPTAVDWGTGFIPKKYLLDRTLSHGVQNAFDSISVRHVSGGVSALGFKAYEQGRTKLQGASLDFIWPDECPPDNIYPELMARIAMTNGIIYTTFTPMKGATGVTARFTDDDSPQAQRDRGRIRAGDHDIIRKSAEHPEGKTEEEINAIIDSYPEYQRAARVNGDIMMGEGAVFEGLNEGMISVPSIRLSEVPPHWQKMWAIDFGIGHAFAAVLLLRDPDTDIIYVAHEIKVADALPQNHIAMMRGIAPEPPVSWPHDGEQREKSNGEELFKFYKPRNGQPGMNMRNTHASFPDGGYSTSAGVTEMLNRMRQGKFFVSASCRKWFQEFSNYHFNNGLIVKINDDLLSATRIGVMDIRHARAVPLGPSMFGLYTAQNRPRTLPERNPFTGKPI